MVVTIPRGSYSNIYIYKHKTGKVEVTQKWITTTKKVALRMRLCKLLVTVTLLTALHLLGYSELCIPVSEYVDLFTRFIKSKIFCKIIRTSETVIIILLCHLKILKFHRRFKNVCQVST